MNASESKEEEEEERQLLGHYFIYVFIIFCLSNVNMWLTGGDHQQVIRHPSKGLELTTMFIQEVICPCNVKLKTAVVCEYNPGQRSIESSLTNPDKSSH